MKMSGSVTFFFFQAEDGRRAIGVTGVQTCALPIYARPAARGLLGSPRRRPRYAGRGRGRSEERRVGKECRSRGSPYHETKKEVGRQDGSGDEEGSGEEDGDDRTGAEL